MLALCIQRVPVPFQVCLLLATVYFKYADVSARYFFKIFIVLQIRVLRISSRIRIRDPGGVPFAAHLPYEEIFVRYERLPPKKQQNILFFYPKLDLKIKSNNCVLKPLVPCSLCTLVFIVTLKNVTKQKNVHLFF